MSDKQIRLDRDAREALQNLIEAAIAKHDPSMHLEAFKRAILVSGFFTQENMEAVADLSFSKGCDYSRSWGLCVGEPAVLLSDILHPLEEETIPDCVTKKYPLLTQREWESAIRIVVMILSSHEL